MTQERATGVFLTGTDTGVGKTTVTAALTIALQQRGLNVGAMKPIETGRGGQPAGDSDSERLRQTASPTSLPDIIRLYEFDPPLAPLAAARLGKKTINCSRIVDAYKTTSRQHDVTLVEGIGGVLTPLTPTQNIRDLMRAFHLPCLVVGRPTIGGINHAQLTIEALHAHHIEILAIVFNQSLLSHQPSLEDLQKRTTIDLMNELTDIPVLGPLSFNNNLMTNWMEGIRMIASEPGIQELAHLITSKIS